MRRHLIFTKLKQLYDKTTNKQNKDLKLVKTSTHNHKLVALQGWETGS